MTTDDALVRLVRLWFGLPFRAVSRRELRLFESASIRGHFANLLQLGACGAVALCRASSPSHSTVASCDDITEVLVCDRVIGRRRDRALEPARLRVLPFCAKDRRLFRGSGNSGKSARIARKTVIASSSLPSVSATPFMKRACDCAGAGRQRIELGDRLRILLAVEQAFAWCSDSAYALRLARPCRAGPARPAATARARASRRSSSARRRQHGCDGKAAWQEPSTAAICERAILTGSCDGPRGRLCAQPGDRRVDQPSRNRNGRR